MPRTPDLKSISVYTTEARIDRLAKAASLDNRSLSNFVLMAAIEKAEALGIKIFGVEDRASARVKKVAARSRR